MISSIWQSFRALPLWVQIWVFAWLVPVSLASAWFWAEPNGVWIALLAIGAMAINGVFMIAERGFSKAMALPHVVMWTPMVIWAIRMLKTGQADGQYAVYLGVLVVTNIISLAFDFKDSRDWLLGARAVSGR